MEATIFWNAPADLRGVDGFRIYKGDENTLIWQCQDAAIRNATIKLSANAKTMVYVSRVSKAGRESPKMPVYVESNSDKYVVDGTTGETAEVSPVKPPEWQQEDAYLRQLFGAGQGPLKYIP